MTFDELVDFLENKMRMSHIYQPLLIKKLIDSGGSSTIRQLALQFLNYDESLIMHYEKTLVEMPIKVLSKHEVIEKSKELVRLKVDKLTFEEKAEIKKICEEKIQNYIKNRGLSIWDYRLIDPNIISDSLRFRILKEAKGRCALCGITKNERPLDIDHIIPKSLGGKTIYSNLQVLCSKCNRSKRNHDKTDFRNYIQKDRDEDCIFCRVQTSGLQIMDNDLAFVVMDKYPVTKGHSLIVTKRHVTDFFSISQAELDAIHDLTRVMRNELLERDKKITGFNFGINNGHDAGQTIDHIHFHLIPRTPGDCINPRGGIRGIIPSLKEY